MGMFDWIECAVPLPDGHKAGRRDLQTKDLDCQLDVYRITFGGRLFKVGSEDGGWSEITAEDVNYNGKMWLIGAHGEYVATFVNGHLLDFVTLLEHNTRQEPR